MNAERKDLRGVPMQHGVMFALALLLFAGSTSRAGSFWDNHAVVFGVIESRIAQDHGQYRLRFRPAMTLTGSFDAGLYDIVDIHMTVGGIRGALPDPPAARHPGVLLIKKSEAGWTVPDTTVSFMPNMSPMVLVSGAEDPKVAETIELIKTTHRSNVGFRVVLYISLKPEAKQQGITQRQIRDRIYEVLPKLKEIDKTDVARISFRQGSNVTVGDLADIDVRFRSPEGFQRLK